MNEQKNFIKSTVILAAANVIAKILGALFKIPITYILKEEGMAMFNTASSVYSLFLTLVISGIPLASSRLISSDTALKKDADALKTVKASKYLLMTLGGISSTVLFALAEPLATAMKDPGAAAAIKMISPSVFFVAWGTAYKSYFQGTGRMIPTAVSQVTEAIIRLAAGYFFAVMFISKALDITAAAAISGVTFGEIIATLILGIMYFFQTSRSKSKLKYKKIYSSLISVAVPMLICSVTLSALNMLDMAIVRNQLLKIRFTPESAEKFLLKYSSYTALFDNLFNELKFSLQGARWLYGAYSGYALTVFHLPIGMISTLSVSILPLVAGNLAKNNMKALRSSCRTAITLTLFCAVPCSVLFFASSDIILKLLFKNTASSHMLSLVSPCLIFLCLSQLFTSIFHAAGKIYEPFKIQLLGILLKLSGNIILIRIPSLNIDGAIISSVISFAFVTFAEAIMLYKTFGITYSLKEIAPPFIAAIPMYIILKFTYTPIYFIFSKPMVAFSITVFSAALVYLLAVSLFSPEGILSFFKKNE